MRILMAVPNYPFPIIGGLERQAHELAKALVQCHLAVHVLSSRFDQEQHRLEMIDGIRVHRVKWSNFSVARFFLSPFSVARVLYNLRRDVDLVHVHNISWLGAFVTIIAKALRLPVITKLPNIGESGIPGMRRRLFGRIRIALFKRSDAIIAMTQESVAELASINYPSTRVLKVTNGITLLPPIKTICSCSSEAVTVVFVGRLLPQKGLIDLLHAWRSVKTRATRPVRLRLIGDGPQADELRALALSLDLRDSIEFFGYCRDVPAELAKADLFVLPSYFEGNSNAILEAMHACLPIVATRVGGAPLQVGNQGERFLVPMGDRVELARRLLELIEDETLRITLGAAMRKRIETMFAIDRIAAVYQQAYNLILSGRRDYIGQINPALFN
jgi:glycosyltransferase involved in cell wall biosynthesis